jgi:hypothetical protein
MAERLIEYKKKISEVWLEKKSKKDSDDDDESGKPRIINK